MGNGAQRGFTLVEVLVAFVIATGSLGLLFAIHSRASDTVVLSKDYALATQLAKSLLAEQRASRHGEAARSGNFDEKFEWQLSAVQLNAKRSQTIETEPVLELIEVTAEVSWTSRDRTRHVELHTITPLRAEPSSDAVPAR